MKYGNISFHLAGGRGGIGARDGATERASGRGEAIGRAIEIAGAGRVRVSGDGAGARGLGSSFKDLRFG